MTTDGKFKVSKLPDELVNFCSRRGNLLLIKGEAGTGKTILSLELLRLFSDRVNGVYLSTRVSPQRLFDQFPHLSDIIKPEHVLDTETDYKPRKGSSEAFDIFDLRLREAPSLIDHLFGLASGIENPFILLDSWDAIIRKLTPNDKAKMEDWLEVLITNTNATLLLVSEEPQETRMDFLVDGVVSLSKSRIEDRVIREIAINKLRGAKINQDKYLFTLDGGRFQHFKPWQWERIPLEKRKFSPENNDGTEDAVSTCVQGLDELLNGGWRKGSFNILELGEGVGDDHFSISIPVAMSFLKNGRAFKCLSSGWEIEYITDSLPMKMSKDVNSRLLFIRPTKTPIPRKSHNVFDIDTSDRSKADKLLELSYQEVAKIEENSKDHIVMGFVDTDVIEREFGPETAMDVLSMESDLVKSSQSIDLAILKEGQRLSKDIVHLASTHWKLARKHGVLIFYGVVPDTRVYVVQTGFEKGYPETAISPIV